VSRRRRVEWVPVMPERGLAERIAGIERERRRAEGKVRSQAFRARERAAEAAHLAAREAAEAGKKAS